MNWVAVDGVRQALRTFRRDWLALARPVRARFAWTLTAAWLAGCALMLVVALVLRGERGSRLETWEAGLLRAIVDAAPIGYGMAVFLESPGNGVVVLPLTLGAALGLMRARRPVEAVAVLASSLLAAVITGVGWLTWDRQRPDIIYPGVPTGGLSAFPSGHMATAVPLYGVLAWLWLRRATHAAERVAAVAVFLLVIGVSGLSRLVLSAHWPSDMVGGLVVGCGWLAVVLLATRRALRAQGTGGITA